MGATEVTKAVSEVNIPEVADKSTDTLVDAEAGGTARGTSLGTSKKFTVEYEIIPTVPICAIISITLLVLGIILLRSDEAHQDTVLGFFSAFLIAFGMIFACPCMFPITFPIIYCLCQCFGIALS